MNNLFQILSYLTIFFVLSLSASTASAGLKVETTTQDLAAITKAIGGEHVDVHSLTLGTRDPHFAVARPSMIRRVYRADLLVVIGADMEIGWLPPLLQSARNHRIQPGNPGYLDLSRVVPLLGKTKGPIDRSMGDVHTKGNPHYWLDPANGIYIANAIAKRLVQLDPGHATAYQANLKTFKQVLNRKLSKWKKDLEHLKGKPVITYHKSLIYLANAFGFQIVDEVEPKPGIAPSAASLNNLMTRIKNENIKLLLIEPYYERRSAEYLKQQTGIQVIVIPQSVGAQTTIKTYVELFDAIVNILSSTGKN